DPDSVQRTAIFRPDRRRTLARIAAPLPERFVTASERRATRVLLVAFDRRENHGFEPAQRACVLFTLVEKTVPEPPAAIGGQQHRAGQQERNTGISGSRTQFLSRFPTGILQWQPQRGPHHPVPV